MAVDLIWLPRELINPDKSLITTSQQFLNSLLFILYKQLISSVSLSIFFFFYYILRIITSCHYA